MNIYFLAILGQCETKQKLKPFIINNNVIPTYYFFIFFWRFIEGKSEGHGSGDLQDDQRHVL